MSFSGEVSWRAWLGIGDRDRMDQVDSAEFGTRARAQAWVERHLTGTPPPERPDASYFGSVDRGTYLLGHGDEPPMWLPDFAPDGMLDAELVDGRVVWRRPGSVLQDRTGHTG